MTRATRADKHVETNRDEERTYSMQRNGDIPNLCDDTTSPFSLAIVVLIRLNNVR